MYDFVLQIITVLSGAVIIYILSRGLKRVEDSTVEQGESFFARLDKWFKKLPLQKLDELFLGFLEKFLRKVRVLNLKVENAINHSIGKLRHSDKENKEKDSDSKKDLFVK